MIKYTRKYSEDRGKSLYNYKGCLGIPCVVWVIIIILGVVIILVVGLLIIPDKLSHRSDSK